jgi:hypothetical protein
MHPIRLLALLAAFALPAQAQHAHGEGKLDVVIDKDSIAINLELPLDAAVGFERAPKNDAKRQRSPRRKRHSAMPRCSCRRRPPTARHGKRPRS